jgi:two-component system copper resistance phosphate regulon response regulator CusR
MRILVIEDEARILEFLRVGLGAEGFVVDGADDGATGLRLALSEPYELVILDLLLPRLDGLQFLTELRRAGSSLPVLIVSARTDLPTKLRSFTLGANDYLAKPFSFDELVARIRVHLRRGAETGDGMRIRAGALELNLARRQAVVGGRVVDLSDREFRLLYHLIARAGEVISRERLLSEVWGYSFDPGSNVVDVCVRRLRKKLDCVAAIETVRNAGYRVTAT